MLGPPGSCAHRPPQEQHTHARLEGPFKSLRPMRTGGKGPAETRLSAEARGPLGRLGPPCLALGTRPQDQSDLEIPSQGPTNLQVCTGECVRVTILEYAPHTMVWTLEESSRSSVQAIQERPSREASQEARMSRQPSTCTSQECCCVKPTPDRSGLGSPACFGVAVKRTVPDGKDTEKYLSL